MKTVGIITFHNAHNYGAVLQSFALQKSLEKLNYNVKIINYSNANIINQYKIFKPFRKNFVLWFKSFFETLKYYDKIKTRYDKFNLFINNQLNLSQKYKNLQELKKNYPVYDFYITGSDQVWNIGIVGELSDAYTLNFGNKNIKRLSYAASTGETAQIINNKRIFIQKLSCLNAISVREDDSKNELQKFINKNISLVIDPTLLITKEEWNNEILNSEIYVKEKYILAYVVSYDEEYFKIVNDLSLKTDLKVVYFDLNTNCYKNPLKCAYDASPFEFINYIKKAEYVVTTSFHATVFSIIFNKKFIVIPHKITGNRVKNLLKMLSIENRAFDTYQDYLNFDYTTQINYRTVNKMLNIKKKQSIEWLINNMGEDET